MPMNTSKRRRNRCDCGNEFWTRPRESERHQTQLSFRLRNACRNPFYGDDFFSRLENPHSLILCQVVERNYKIVRKVLYQRLESGENLLRHFSQLVFSWHMKS